MFTAISRTAFASALFLTLAVFVWAAEEKLAKMGAPMGTDTKAMKKEKMEPMSKEPMSKEKK